MMLIISDQFQFANRNHTGLSGWRWIITSPPSRSTLEVLGEFQTMNQIISRGVGCTLKQMKREPLSLSIYTHLHIAQLFSCTQIQPYAAYCDQYRPVFKMHLSTQRKTDEDNDNELTEGEWVLDLKKIVEWLVEGAGAGVELQSSKPIPPPSMHAHTHTHTQAPVVGCL